MDLSTVLHAMVDAERAKTFANSDQLSLGELILKLEALPDKSKVVIFDFGNNVPTGLCSWRGRYAELCLNYENTEPKNANQVIEMLRDANGKTYVGYKGDDFTMSLQTPIWVANYSESGIRNYKDSTNYEYVAVVDVEDVEDGDKVILITKVTEL